MSTTDITQKMKELHEEEIMQSLMDEVKDELKNGVPNDLQNELDSLLAKTTSAKTKNKSNIIALKPRSSYKQQVLKSFASVELLAAAGQSLGEWFSTPISFSDEGFVLDIRRVIGTDDEVDLYISSHQDNSEKMKKSLVDYVGQEMKIIISNEEVVLLEASLYIDETGAAVEGSGTLLQIDKSLNIKGKFTIDILD